MTGVSESLTAETATEQQGMRITKAAMAQLDSLLSQESEEKLVRISLRSGGCKRISYNIDFVPKDSAAESDRILAVSMASGAPLQLVIDPHCLLHISGVQLDFSDALLEGGFKFSSLHDGRPGAELILPI